MGDPILKPRLDILLAAASVGPPYGGMQYWLHDLVSALSPSHNLTVIGPAEHDLARLEQRGAHRVIPVEGFRRLTTDDPAALAQQAVTAAEAAEAGLVHLCETSLSFMVPALREAGFPVVVTLHSNEMTRPWLWRHDDPQQRSAALRRCISEANRLTTVSRFSRSLAVEAGIKLPTDVIPCVVDVNRFQPGDRTEARRKLGLPLERPILLSVGRLVSRKGHLDVVDALPALISRSPLYVIAGKGMMEPEIRVRAAEQGVQDDLLLVDWVEEDEIVSLYQAADIFVLPVIERWDERGHDVEGFGIVYLEAAACGLPCIGSNSGGVPDAVANGETGILIPPGDVEALARAIGELSANPDRARAMGQAGRRRVETGFTLQHLAQRITRVYQEVLAVNRVSALSTPRIGMRRTQA